MTATTEPAGADVAATTTPILEAAAISTGYGGIQVLWDTSLTIRSGESVALIGANGAGKSTLLRTLAGQLKPWAGAVHFEGRHVTQMPAHDRVKAGMVMVPEGRQLFAGLTVRENLLMGAYARDDRSGVEQDLERVRDLFPRLKERDTQLAGHMSGGEQQMCAIGRALMSRPKLLMIDELSLGLAPVIIDRLIEAIQEVHRRGVTLLIVEQDVGNALTMAERGYVIESGRITLEGSRDMLMQDKRVQESFIGI